MRAGAVPGKEGKIEKHLMQEIAAHAAHNRALKRDIEKLELEAKQIEDGIKQMLQRAGTRRAEGEGVSVVWSALKGRPSFDMPALREAARAAGLDLAPFETVGEPSDRLTIRLDKAVEAAA
jgi:hypothetical protein